MKRHEIKLSDSKKVNLLWISNQIIANVWDPIEMCDYILQNR
jgi:hypothetical protein